MEPSSRQGGGTRRIALSELQQCAPGLRVAPAGVRLVERCRGTRVAAQPARLGHDVPGFCGIVDPVGVELRHDPQRLPFGLAPLASEHMELSPVHRAQASERHRCGERGKPLLGPYR